MSVIIYKMAYGTRNEVLNKYCDQGKGRFQKTGRRWGWGIFVIFVSRSRWDAGAFNEQNFAPQEF